MIAYYLNCPTHGRQEPWKLEWRDAQGAGWEAVKAALLRRHPAAEVWHTNTYGRSDTPVLDFRAENARRLLCGLCQYESELLRPIRIAIRPPKRKGAPPQCGGACLNGKRSCDCQCRGRCHGAQSCSCAEAIPAA